MTPERAPDPPPPSLFDVLGEPAPATQSLAALTQDNTPLAPPGHSRLTQLVAEAWSTPLPSLTCAQARLLTGQRLGLAWLAGPVARLALSQPDLRAEHYPGDLTLAALWAFADLLGHAPREAWALADLDFAWMAQAYANDDELSSHAAGLIAAARALTEPVLA